MNSPARTREVPPDLEPLFHSMADGGPGLLSVLSVSASGLVRMRYDVSPPGGRRSVRNFSLSRSGDLIKVRVPGCPDVLVSAVPSAVLAVALR